MQVSQGKGDSGTDHIGRGKTLLAGTGAGAGGWKRGSGFPEVRLPDE